ncbi:MAG: YabP/YqfC family sporulation protein [Clostridia bacterium]|nr:YabP/YqfC family sporulation protein [Clostridia bacterium]
MAKNRKKIPVFYGDMITVFNQKRVVLEGVERIVFCDSEKMIFRKNRLITVEGKKLVLEELGNDNIAVKGSILALRFEEV